MQFNRSLTSAGELTQGPAMSPDTQLGSVNEWRMAVATCRRRDMSLGGLHRRADRDARSLAFGIGAAFLGDAQMRVAATAQPQLSRTWVWRTLFLAALVTYGCGYPNPAGAG